jgi:hypothetical protein
VGSVFSFRKWEAFLPFCRREAFSPSGGKHIPFTVKREFDPSFLPMGSIESAILPFCQWEASKVRSFRFANGKPSFRSAEGKRFLLPVGSIFSFREREKCDASVLPMGSIFEDILPFCRREAFSPSGGKHVLFPVERKGRSFRFADEKHLPRPSNGMNGKAMTTVYDLDETSHSFGTKTETRFPYLFCEILLLSSIPQTC